MKFTARQQLGLVWHCCLRVYVFDSLNLTELGVCHQLSYFSHFSYWIFTFSHFPFFFFLSQLERRESIELMFQSSGVKMREKKKTRKIPEEHKKYANIANWTSNESQPYLSVWLKKLIFFLLFSFLFSSFFRNSNAFRLKQSFNPHQLMIWMIWCGTKIHLTNDHFFPFMKFIAYFWNKVESTL